jgi:hypothetical protein
MAISTLLLILPLTFAVHLATVAVEVTAPGVAPTPCPAIACKDHLDRTHCPDKAKQCEQPSHGPCAPCAPSPSPGPACPAQPCAAHPGRTYCPNDPDTGQCDKPMPHKPCPPCQPPLLACQPPHHTYPFCDTSLSVPDRINDLIGRINDTDKPGLLTARAAVALPYLGVPAYYWCALLAAVDSLLHHAICSRYRALLDARHCGRGTNCIHGISDLASCVRDSKNRTRCATNFPSGPSFAATFDRDLMQAMAAAIGKELRAFVALGSEGIRGGSNIGLDCWGPVVNLARDPRWVRKRATQLI